MKRVVHTSSPDIPYSVTDRSSWDKVQLVVHLIVNHPHRATTEWYARTVKSLGHASLIPKNSNHCDNVGKNDNEDELSRQRLLSTLFAEIIAILWASHAVSTFYCVMDLPLPALPILPDNLPKPSFATVMTSGMLTRRAQQQLATTVFRQQQQIIDAKHRSYLHVVPYINPYKDINPESDTFLAFPQETRDYLMGSSTTTSTTINNQDPLALLSLSPCSMAMVGLLQDKLSRHSTNSYCKGFTHKDWEMIQTAMQTEYQEQASTRTATCSSRNGRIMVANNDRELLLQLLCQAVVSPKQSSTTTTKSIIDNNKTSQVVVMLQQVAHRIQNEMGNGALVECAAAVAWAELHCKTTDVNKTRIAVVKPKMRSLSLSPLRHKHKPMMLKAKINPPVKLFAA